MPKRTRLVPYLLLPVFAASCLAAPDGPLAPPEAPAFAISDAANGGRAGFYFGPPIAPPVAYPGTFDATLLPILALRICPIDASGACTGPDVVITAASPPPQRLDIGGESYGSPWMGSTPGDYRARVHAGAAELGFADIRVVATGRDLRSVPAGFHGAVRNAAVSIRFRIETGTVGRVLVEPAAARIVVGGEGSFTATVLDLHDNPMGGENVDWSVDPAAIASVAPASGSTDAAGQTSTTATGTAEGTGTVRATVRGATGTADLTVHDLSRIVGSSTIRIPRADACGRADGRICESLVGNVVADALRAAYGAAFAITNAGGLRADMTCPIIDLPLDFCPPFVPPPHPITRGKVLSVLPFGNRAFTVDVSGAELKAMLENGVSAMPAANGRFAQVSGLCFTYDIAAAAGSRVMGAVRQAADGTCTGPAVDLTGGAMHSIVINDFMAAGGDAYPNLLARGTVRDLMADDVIAWLGPRSPITPTIQGRVTCTTSGATACPVVVP